MQQGNSTKLNLEGLEMQKWNTATDRARRADEKKWVILSSYLGYFIVIRNKKIVWKVVWVEYYFRLNLSTQATTAYIKCKHWMCWKVRMVKTTIFFIFNQLLGALYLNLFLIDDLLCKLCNIWLLLCENNSRSITIPKLNTGGTYCCSYYQDKVIDDNWKKQIKNRTFCTCRLFLLT